MNKLFLLILVLFFTVSVSIAASHKDNNPDRPGYSEHDKRHDDLKALLKEIKYEMRHKLRKQEETIDKQDELIDEMRFAIKELEYELFQTTQSLRNLELEVWDLKKAAHERTP